MRTTSTKTNRITIAAAAALAAVSGGTSALASSATPHIPAMATLTTVIRNAAGPKVTGGIGTIARVTVSCKAGEVAVGGGGEPADGNWAILLSRPENTRSGTTGTPTKWRVDFGNYHDTTNTGAIPNAYAVCERG